MYILLYELFVPITAAAWIFHFAVLLYIINRDEIPEMKMPWLVIMFLLPVIGAYIFMLLSSDNASRKEYARYSEAEHSIERFTAQTAALEELMEHDTDAYLQANYIYSQTKMPCRENTAITYYPIGEDFHAALLRELRKAKNYIFMEYFILQEGAMWEPIHELLLSKVGEGVEVFFIYDDFGCFGVLPWHYYKTLNSEGIHCEIANKFSPILSHIHNNRDHRKITVIDGKVGFTGGINIADEYINAVDKHGHWKDTAIKLEGEGVRNLMMLFLTNWNTNSKRHLLDCEKYMNTPPYIAVGKGAVIPFGCGPKPIYKDNIGKNVYLNIIHSAHRYLYITTPYLICDREILNALCLAAQKGVDVRLITPHHPDKKIVFWMTRSNYRILLDAGVRIFEYTPGFIHAKNLVCDDKFAVCGTINLDYRSLVHHFECAAWMHETDCIPDMKEDFLRTERQSGEVDKNKTVMRSWQRFIADILKIFSPLF